MGIKELTCSFLFELELALLLSGSTQEAKQTGLLFPSTLQKKGGH